ncbi:hypothetical protein BKP37_05855 [Anaerobacillus alkalilacustris]|uniref:Peptidase S54 rhomboid domain-containing protein n=1 Tax=Anaerobacillus alkalilacustris TaxID=393763 RepID=A0A1S2LW61_9BACI|nr:rhomboid family intramembrane serine protease [Anaerobacillus alkalilacustris]OIJ16749.1 hypothetical protein BKP37_05855 [Anaerobacillus alkalilacustris]
MESLSQDIYFWRLIHYLVCQEGMSVIQVADNEREYWLEKEDFKETTVIRIVRQDVNWSNMIGRDIENLAIRGDGIRKELKSKHLKIHNVYVSNYLPIDSLYKNNNLLEKRFIIKNKSIKISSYIIDGEKGNQFGVINVSEALKVKLPRVNVKQHFLNLEEIQHYRQEVLSISDQRLKKQNALFTYGKPIFTYILLVMIIGVFGVIEYYGSSESLLTLIEFGAKYDPLIIEGEWWRFFTAIFLHIGFFHLLMNSLALFYLGSAVERIYGTTRFIMIYCFAGVIGSISSFAFNHQISAGASGAIFGCFGALLYFGIIYRKLFIRKIGVNIIVVLLINLVLGFMLPVIDNSAHIGGLIGGFFASSIFHLPKHKIRVKQISAFIFTTISVSLLLFYGFSTNQETETTHLINVQIAQELLQRGEIERAYSLLKNAVDSDIDIVEVKFLLAYSEAKMGLLKDAEKNLLITVEQRPFLHEAHFNLALIYYEFKQYVDAFEAVQSALELEPNNQDYQKLRDAIKQKIENVKG